MTMSLKLRHARRQNEARKGMKAMMLVKMLREYTSCPLTTGIDQIHKVPSSTPKELCICI
jgi:hypothetical protein